MVTRHDYQRCKECCSNRARIVKRALKKAANKARRQYVCEVE